MKALYAGKCAVTGRSYAVGTEIVKSARGWALAGASPSTQNHPQPEWVRLASGKLTKIPLHFPLFCRNCVIASGKNPADYAGTTDLTPLMPYARQRQGQELVCLQCADNIHILTEAEIKAEFPPRPAETKRCWECGCAFTYAECRRNGGDWNENGGYCGC